MRDSREILKGNRRTGEDNITLTVAAGCVQFPIEALVVRRCGQEQLEVGPCKALPSLQLMQNHSSESHEASNDTSGVHVLSSTSDVYDGFRRHVWQRGRFGSTYCAGRSHHWDSASSSRRMVTGYTLISLADLRHPEGARASDCGDRITSGLICACIYSPSLDAGSGKA